MKSATLNELNRPTDTAGAPSWVKDQFVALDESRQGHERREFFARHPGVAELFQDLVDDMPNPNSGSSEFPMVAMVAIPDPETGKYVELARSGNEVNKRGDSTAHAEILALQDAVATLDDKHIEGALLLTNIEPCAMCAGACVHSGIDTVVYGVSQDELKGRHAKVSGDFKPHRTTPEGTDMREFLVGSGVSVVGGLMRDEVLANLERYNVSLSEHYRDPDELHKH